MLGPCGGKTTAIEWLKNHLRANGFIVLTVPESSTMLLTSGAVYPGYNSSKEVLLAYETALLKLQLNLEDSLNSISNFEAPILGAPDAHIIVLMDRGVMDIKAYVPPDVWSAMLSAVNFNEDQLLQRYDAVFHLSTTAKGAEQFYTLENNAARTEGIEEARRLDDLTMAAWGHHGYHYVIANNETEVSFERKMVDLMTAFNSYLESTKSL